MGMNMGMRACKRKTREEKEIQGEGQRENESRLSSSPDQILVEILIRLPSSKFVGECRLVCKRWNSNICSRYFISRFDSYHGQKGEKENSFTLVFEWEIPRYMGGKFQMLSLDGKSNTVRTLVLPPLNSNFIRSSSDLAVQAAYRDLLLLSGDGDDSFTHQLFVVNLVTRQSIALPLPPLTGREIRTRTFSRAGLLFDYSADSNLSFSFKVIRIVCVTFVAAEIEERYPIPDVDTAEFSVQIFSSDTNQWTQYTVDWYPFRWTHFLAEFPIISHNGMFHWLNPTSLVSLNPFHLVVDDHFRLQLNRTIDSPDKDLLAPYFALGINTSTGTGKTLLGFGVSGAHLHVITYKHLVGGDRSLFIWQLDNNKTTGHAHRNGDCGNGDGQWSLVHKVLVSALPLLRCISSSEFGFKFLAFHPYERHALYVQVADLVYLINLGTSKSKKCKQRHSYDTVCPLKRALPPLLPQWFSTQLMQTLADSRA